MPHTAQGDEASTSLIKRAVDLRTLGWYIQLRGLASKYRTFEPGLAARGVLNGWIARATYKESCCEERSETNECHGEM